MKRISILLVLTTLLLASLPGTSQTASVARDRMGPRYEYAVVKWDGPDRIYYNMPDKFDLVYLSKEGVTVPKNAQPEEFCLAYAVNKLSAEGWEAVGIDSRRILMRRMK